jgi:hypothetical protein
LSILESLRDFRNIISSDKIIGHTDHKKLTHTKSTSDKVMRWRLLIEEFGQEFRHVKGKHNFIADDLSGL